MKKLITLAALALIAAGCHNPTSPYTQGAQCSLLNPSWSPTQTIEVCKAPSGELTVGYIDNH
jgi:hypothetical protein